jgi:putative membrane protein
MKYIKLSSAVLATLATTVMFGATAQVPRIGTPDGENALSADSPNVAGAPQKTDSGDVEFLTEALRTSSAEIEMGELAQQRGTPAVKDLGKKIAADHTRAAGTIKQLLGTRNVTTAAEPTVGAEAHTAALAKLSGAEFDKAYLQLMVESHEKAIEEYGAQTHANPNKQLSEFASQSLPTLREHLAAAKALQQRT